MGHEEGLREGALLFPVPLPTVQVDLFLVSRFLNPCKCRPREALIEGWGIFGLAQDSDSNINNKKKEKKNML